MCRPSSSPAAPRAPSLADRLGLATALLATLVAASGCGAPELGPLARLAITPARLCEGAPPTAVILDGSGSLPPAGESDALEFAWTLSRPYREIVRGDLDEATVVLELHTDGAVGISLTVRAVNGTENFRAEVLPLTRRAIRPCLLGCAADELCTPVGGVESCVTDLDCSDDSECDCLRCAPDDRGRRLCLPG